MPQFLTSGAMLECSFGMTPAPFDTLPLPGKPTFLEALIAGTIEDIVPLLNIPSFGMCRSMANPEVIAATAAAEGVLTPMPCIPVTEVPWEPSSLIASFADLPLATIESKTLCTWGGEISVVAPDETFAETV